MLRRFILLIVYLQFKIHKYLGCKTGGKTVAQSRATRAVNVQQPLKTDYQLMYEAASPECS